MPRATKKPSDNPVPEEKPIQTTKPRFACDDKAPWGGFLNVKLTDEDADDFHEWFAAAQQETGWALLHDAMKDGIKLSVTWDGENSTFIATFTGDLLQVGDRRAASSRAPYWAQAVLLAVWKHFIKLDCDYSSTVTPGKGWKSFG